MFLDDPRVPEPDAFLGEEDDEDVEPESLPTPEDLQEDPDIMLVLEAAERLPEFSS